MRTTDYFLLVVIAILVVLSGIFSMSDMVYGVVNQLRLKKDVEKGSKRAKIALDFASNYDTTISTILFSNNLVNIAASSLSAIVGLRIFSSLDNSIIETIICKREYPTIREPKDKFTFGFLVGLKLSGFAQISLIKSPVFSSKI